MTAELQNGQPRFVPPPPIAVSHELPSSISSVSLTTVPIPPQGISIPKIGTLIPNRIFVGGISSNTTEEELKSFFSTFGTIKDVKVICDKSGLAKGSYGFVTFENQETAEAIIKNEAEPLIFKDRKLNIGYAVRKQHIFPKQEIAGSVLLARSACHFANGLTLFQLCSHDHPILTMNQPSLYYPTTLVVSPAVSNHELCATNTLPGNIAYVPGTANIAPVGENFTCPVSVTGVLLTQARSIANPGIQTSVPFYTAHLGSIQPQVGNWKLASNGNESANTAVAKASTSKTNCESDANKADQIKKPSVTTTQATPFTPISNTDLPGLQSTTTQGTHNELSCRLYNSCPPQILLRPSDVRFLDQAECSGKNSFQNKLPSTTAENQIKVSTIDSCCNSKSDGLRWQIPMHNGNHSTAQRNQSLLSLQQSSSFCSEHNSHASIATSSDDPKLNIQVLTENRRAKTENVNMIPVDGLQMQPANQASTSWTCPHCCAATEARGTMELQTPITNFAPHCDSSFYALRDTAEVQAPTANIAFQPQASTSTDDCTVQDVRHILLGYPAECHGETAGAASHSVTHRVYSGVSTYNGQRNPLNMKSPDGSLTEGSRQQTAFHFAWKNNASETFNTLDSFASSARDMDRDQLKVNNAAFSGQNWHLTEEVHGRDEPLQSMPMRLDLLNMLMTPPQQKTSLRNEGVRTSISHDFTFESPSTLTPNSPKSSNEPYAKFDHLQPPEQEFYHLARNAEPILSKTNSCGVNTSQSLVTNNGTFACGDITKHRSN